MNTIAGYTVRFAKALYDFVRSYDDGAYWPRHLPAVDVDRVFPKLSDRSVRLRHRYEWRTLPFGDAFILAAIVDYLQPRKIFEIGTFTGASTILLAEHGGPRCKVFTLDLPEDERTLLLPGVPTDPPERNSTRIGKYIEESALSDQVCQLRGDSASFDFTPYKGTIDLVFIDGSHSAEYVANDTNKALSMLSSRGTIIWDDCSLDFPGVIRTLDDLAVRLPVVRIAGTKFAVYRRQDSGEQPAL